MATLNVVSSVRLMLRILELTISSHLKCQLMFFLEKNRFQSQTLVLIKVLKNHNLTQCFKCILVYPYFFFVLSRKRGKDYHCKCRLDSKLQKDNSMLVID
jgi:hypothetical protein